MRTAILITRDAAGASTMVGGPEKPYDELRKQFDHWATKGLPSKVSSAELWKSDGHRKRIKAPPPEAKAAKAAKGS
jgi:hypothetical protein